MRALGLSQASLAKEIGVADSIISKLLSGKRAPSLELAVKLSRASVAIPVDVWFDANFNAA